MEWRNALRDELPEHLEKVLVCVEGIYYVCVFHAGELRFYLENDPDSWFDIDQRPIYWVGDVVTFTF